jgi:hypothetical protein
LPGTFSKSARPLLPGGYTNFESGETDLLPVSAGATVAVPIVHDWGPLDTSVYVQTAEQFRSIFGASDTPGSRAVLSCFKGEGLDGKGGAGAVLVHRMGADSATKATKALQNTTSAAAITLNAKYEGVRGNLLRVTVQDYATDASKDELLIYDGTVLLERYVYANTDITVLAASINAESDWVTATDVATDEALTYVATQAFSSGADGATLLAADWTALMTALETERFGVLAPYDLTDSSILASFKTWVQSLNAAGKRFMAVFGGAAGETNATATARSITLNDPNIVNVGQGSLTDSAGVVWSTSQLAPRVAGILAQRGESKAITMARLAGMKTINGGATVADHARAFAAGLVVFSRDSNRLAPIRVTKALTTFSSGGSGALAADGALPYKVYSNPKFVRTMHNIEAELTEYVEAEDIIGELPVNDKTRELVIGELAVRFKAREDAEIIQPGWTAAVDRDPPPSDDDEFVGVRYGVKFSRSVEQVFNTIVVS